MSSLEALKKHEIIPEVVDSFVPSTSLEISFPKGIVKEGEEFSPSDVAKEPKVIWKADSDTFYTLIKCDPDAPSRQNPKYREWRHWVVMNIPGNSLSKGDVVTSYAGAGPPKGTGFHRYVFLLFKQPGKLTPPSLSENRGSWKVREFASQCKLGNPIAAAFYRAKNS
jgi:phosphatidylethanolamine-binding protein (PEBP) family uncharacterized protein